MATPAAYKALRKAQREENKKATAAWQIERKRRIEEERRVYNTTFNALIPYHRAKLDKDRTTIVGRPRKMEIEVLLNGERLTLLRVVRVFSHCNCDGPCGCPVTSGVEVKSDPYFWFEGRGWFDDAKALAAAFQRNIREHKERKDWAEWREKDRKAREKEA